MREKLTSTQSAAIDLGRAVLIALRENFDMMPPDRIVAWRGWEPVTAADMVRHLDAQDEIAEDWIRDMTEAIATTVVLRVRRPCSMPDATG